MNEIPGGSVTFLSAFLVGLALNLTPCVYPMISVTISLFGAKKESQSHLTSFVKALVYVLGIATMYTTLGVTAAFTGEIFGVLLQSKWVLIGIGLLLILLSLSMFGVYNFQIPPWLIQKLGSGRRIGFVGIYLSGLLVGIFAAPCIGPPIVAMLTFAGTRGDVWFAFWIFFAMSLGLGLPYLILGTYSRLIQKLPKSGTWMVWVERLFGVVLLSVAAFYLTIAIYPSFLHLLPMVCILLGGIYLGFLDPTGKTSAGFVTFKRLAGLAAILLSFFLFYGTPKTTVVWETYTPEKLTLAQESKKPVILDFYADWCIPCHELDQFTYSDPKVQSALNDFVKIKIDLTNPENPAFAKLIENYELLGVPTVIFLGPDGKEAVQARLNGFVTPEEFLEVIQSLPWQQN